MGEATYYIAAQFAERDLPGVVDRLEALLAQCGEAEDFWQAHRGMRDPKAFWAQFEAEFPLVYNELLRGDVNRDDCNNSLAGCFDYRDLNERTPEVSVRGDTRLFYSATVWHFADWGGLEDWLYRQGAQQVVWYSDEYFDFFDALESDLELLALKKAQEGV